MMPGLFITPRFLRVADPTMPDANPQPLISVIEEALGYEAEAFGKDHPVEGADLVEWFVQWRLRAQAALAAAIGNKTSH